MMTVYITWQFALVGAIRQKLMPHLNWPARKAPAAIEISAKDVTSWKEQLQDIDLRLENGFAGSDVSWILGSYPVLFDPTSRFDGRNDRIYTLKSPEFAQQSAGPSGETHLIGNLTERDVHYIIRQLIIMFKPSANYPMAVLERSGLLPVLKDHLPADLYI